MSFLGEQSEHTIDICNVQVAYPGGQNGTNTYEAPDGTAILAYSAVVRGKSSNSGYSFSVGGDNSVFVSKEAVQQKFQRVFDYLRESGNDHYKERVEKLMNDAVAVATMTASTHSRLVTNWYCHHEGNDFNRVGGNLNLAVSITLIKSLSIRNIDTLIQKIIEAISRGEQPNNIRLET